MAAIAVDLFVHTRGNFPLILEGNLNFFPNWMECDPGDSFPFDFGNVIYHIIIIILFIN